MAGERMRWGRHRKSAEAYAPSPPDEVRARATQPRDRRGRFRVAGRDDGSVGTKNWDAFELDDEPPRAKAHPPDRPHQKDGLAHCGALERILYRQWDALKGIPSPEVVRAVESLAALPNRLKEKLARGLDGIYVGPGGVPDLDDMGHLKG